MTTTAPTASLIHVDPAELVIGENIRTGVVITDTPEFVQSVAEQGVLSPITATRRPDGTLRIHDGQRRILAARESGLASVPVMVTAESGDDRQAQIRRVTGQLHANDQRTPITDRHRVGAVTELLDLGLDVEQIAKATKLGPKFTRAAATAGRSPNADRHLADRRLTLEDAALVADLEAAAQRYPSITARLEGILSRGYGITWNLRDVFRMVTDMDARAAAAAEYTERGFALLHDEPSTTTGDWFALTDLRTPDGDPIPADAPEKAPALWHVHAVETGTMWLNAAGDEVDETTVDWDTADDPDLEVMDGHVHAASVTKHVAWSFEFFLHHSHRGDAGWKLAPEIAAVVDEYAEDGMSPSERAVAHAEADRKDAERAERRRTIALNRAGATATEMRRTFLSGLLSAKIAPKNTTRWVVGVLAQHPTLLTESKAFDLYSDITGSRLDQIATTLTPMSAERCEVLLLARVLTAYEARLTGPQDAKDYWRYAKKNYRGLDGIDTYLTFLADAGHTLSAVEQAAIGNITVDAAYATLDED